MSWREANSLVTLLGQINAAYPNRNKASDGTIGDAAHQASASDHNPNAAGVVCALDITQDPASGCDTFLIADAIRRNRQKDLKYIISNRRIAGAWSNWQWQVYTGSDPHTNHMHVSVGVGYDGQSTPPYDDTDPWDISIDGSTPAPAPAPSYPTATVTANTLYVRSQPNTSAPLAGSQVLYQGNTFQYTGKVQGQSVGGNATWLVSTRGNYCWSGGTNVAGSSSTGGTAQVVRTANVRSAPNTSAPLAGSMTLAPGATFQYSGKVQGESVSGNSVWYHSTKGNYVWSGNCKDI
jgi:hypothetical protein